MITIIIDASADVVFALELKRFLCLPQRFKMLEVQSNSYKKVCGGSAGIMRVIPP